MRLQEKLVNSFWEIGKLSFLSSGEVEVLLLHMVEIDMQIYNIETKQKIIPKEQVGASIDYPTLPNQTIRETIVAAILALGV